jgi:hypothetical protein
LRTSSVGTHTASLPDDAWKREDVDAIVGGVWDIKMLLVQLVQLLGDDEEEEDQ